MQAAHKKQVILRLLAVGGPVLLTLILLLMAVTQVWLRSESESLNAAPNELANKDSVPHRVTSKSTVGSAVFNVAATSGQKKKSRGFKQSGSNYQQSELHGPLLTAPNRLPVRAVSTNRPAFDDSQPYRQPLSDALEAMVEKETIDPLGDDLFLNTSSLEKLNQQLIPEVRSGFQLGKSGAIYAAREQFIYVLRRVAIAKDAKEHSDRHMKALAQGLRALDEADDFTPHGDSIEAELNTLEIGASHATPVLHRFASAANSDDYDEIMPEMLTPHQASAEYARYAAKQLSEAMAEEEAGSMALYGLGKTFARLEAQTKLQAQARDTTAGLKCNVMYRAAALAHPENYLAANELGVRLAKAGRYESARQVLQMAASQPANATVYENLAAVEFKLGNTFQAKKIERAGHQIAMRERMQNEVSRRHGVSWVSPDEFRSAGPSPQFNQQNPQRAGIASAPTAELGLNNPQPYQATSTPPLPAGQATPADRESSPRGWKTAFNYVKKATGWEKDSPKVAAEPVPVYSRPSTQLARRPGSGLPMASRTAALPTANVLSSPPSAQHNFYQQGHQQGQQQGYYPQDSSQYGTQYR